MTAPASATCVMCARPAGDGHACQTCARTIRDQLATITWLAGELVVTLTRQDRIASSGGRHTATTPLGYHAGARQVLDALHATLTTWARDIAPDAQVADNPAAIADWLATVDLRHHPAVDELSADLRRQIDRALMVINPDTALTYGKCGEPTATGPCPAYLYGEPDATWVRCNRCGTQHETRGRVQALRQRARALYLPAATMARLLPALLPGRPVTASNIRNWAAEGRPIRRQVDTAGRTAYSVGDVIDVATVTPVRHRSAITA